MLAAETFYKKLGENTSGSFKKKSKMFHTLAAEGAGGAEGARGGRVPGAGVRGWEGRDGLAGGGREEAVRAVAEALETLLALEGTCGVSGACSWGRGRCSGGAGKEWSGQSGRICESGGGGTRTGRWLAREGEGGAS
jgi:hypothetical protein